MKEILLRDQSFRIEIKLLLFLLMLSLINKGFGLKLDQFYYILTAIAICFFFLKNRKYSRNMSFVDLFILFFLYLLTLGIFNNNFSSFIFIDIFNFSAFLTLYVRGKYHSNNYYYTKVLPKFGLWVNIISILISFIWVSAYGLAVSTLSEGRGIIDNSDVSTSLMSAKYLMYGSLFLYPLVTYVEKKSHRSIYFLGLIMFIIFSLLMGSRGSSVLALIILLVTSKINMGNNKIQKSQFTKYLIIFIGSISLFGFSNLISSFNYLTERFVSESLGDYRNEESLLVLDSLSVQEFLFGRGFGAANKYWIFEHIENGVNTVHYGPVFLILKGGILLLIFIYSYLIKSFTRLWKIKYLRPYAIIIFTFVVLDFSHNNYSDYFKMVYVFFAIGIANQLKNENITH